MTITILPDNEVRFSIGQDTIAIAGLVYFELEDHAQMDIVASSNRRFKCPPKLLPDSTTMKIWAVTLTGLGGSGGCFWAYDLHTVETYLQGLTGRIDNRSKIAHNITNAQGDDNG